MTKIKFDIPIDCQNDALVVEQSSSFCLQCGSIEWGHYNNLLEFKNLEQCEECKDNKMAQFNAHKLNPIRNKTMFTLQDEMIKKTVQLKAGGAVAGLFEYKKWKAEIPYLRFQNDWDVKIIPPYYNAVVRFLVRKGTKEVSVYLDCYGLLGSYGEPYWEIYPYEDDIFRCGLYESDELIKAIKAALEGD